MIEYLLCVIIGLLTTVGAGVLGAWPPPEKRSSPAVLVAVLLWSSLAGGAVLLVVLKFLESLVTGAT